MDAVLTLYAVQLTARVSAVLLAAGLIFAARRLRYGDRATLWRRLDIGAFATLVGSHTVHFTCLILLARATGGASITNRGGWIPAVVVAALFYLGCGFVLSLKLRRRHVWKTPRERWAEVLILGVLWIVFFQAYAGRLQARVFAFLALYLFYALVTFAVAAAKSPLEGADPRVLQSV